MAQPPISAAAEGGLKGLWGAAAELRWCFRVSRAFGIRKPAMKLHTERAPFKPQSLDFTAGPGLLQTSRSRSPESCHVAHIQIRVFRSAGQRRCTLGLDAGAALWRRSQWYAGCRSPFLHRLLIRTGQAQRNSTDANLGAKLWHGTTPLMMAQGPNMTLLPDKAKPSSEPHTKPTLRTENPEREESPLRH